MYCDRIMGQRIDAACVKRVLATGQKVRFHATRKWRKLYWTCDRHGEIWRTSKSVAWNDCPEVRRDIVQ